MKFDVIRELGIGRLQEKSRPQDRPLGNTTDDRTQTRDTVGHTHGISLSTKNRSNPHQGFVYLRYQDALV